MPSPVHPAALLGAPWEAKTRSDRMHHSGSLTLHQLALAFLHVSTTTTCRRPGFDLEPYSSTNIANFLNSRKNQRNSCALGLLLGTIRFSWNKQYPLSSTLLIHKSRSLQSFSSK
ncbi:hypothetical protein PGTUg99_015981 [Puccinia graminis f. sp. tritici]|uniref:Uncharacterized protein n=1 Tax=Puccinia graminis f. sp. tritici TaxID=56615 RepID=A0A5B0SJ50_PUCGR|nr:hypothetical protein PGTUg99_015981 [Puccinia graminis f. sp. tritici]